MPQRTATIAATNPRILIELKNDCNALLPDDDVFVTVQGDHYHRQSFIGNPQTLAGALSGGLRPCSHCLPNQ